MFLFILAIDCKLQILIIFTNCSFARNSRDVTMKQLHSVKHSEVNRRVVAVFKVAICINGDMVVSNCKPFCRIRGLMLKNRWVIKCNFLHGANYFPMPYFRSWFCLSVDRGPEIKWQFEGRPDCESMKALQRYLISISCNRNCYIHRYIDQNLLYVNLCIWIE